MIVAVCMTVDLTLLQSTLCTLPNGKAMNDVDEGLFYGCPSNLYSMCDVSVRINTRTPKHQDGSMDILMASKPPINPI